MSDAGPARALVVEDDRTTADLVALYLRHEGLRVFVEHDGDRARARLDDEPFDLLILDVMLPGTDGLALCRKARTLEGGGPAVIMLTARTTEDDRVEGLDLGADDYVTKPFSPRELVARVRAVLRRVPPSDADQLRRGPLLVDRTARRVTVDGKPVALTPSELAVLEALARRPGHVKSRRQLLDALPDPDRERGERTVDVHVRNLRMKLDRADAPPLIETVTGLGYRFAAGDG